MEENKSRRRAPVGNITDHHEYGEQHEVLRRMENTTCTNSWYVSSDEERDEIVALLEKLSPDAAGRAKEKISGGRK